MYERFLTPEISIYDEFIYLHLPHGLNGVVQQQKVFLELYLPWYNTGGPRIGGWSPKTTNEYNN